MSDLAPWMSALADTTAAGAVVMATIQANRQRFAQDWIKQVLRALERDEDDVQAAIVADPALGELIYNAWDAASQSASEEKRAVLARVVTAAIRGDAGTAIDELPYLQRAVAALEPPDLRLLVVLAQPSLDSAQLQGTSLIGAMTPQDLERAWPESAELLAPMLAALSRQGLIDDIGRGTIDSIQAWSLNVHGRKLLRFLDGPGVGWLDEAEVTAVLENPSLMVIKNLGPGLAHDVELDGPRNAGGHLLWSDGPPGKSALPAGRQVRYGLRERSEDPYPATVKILWCDGRGPRQREVVLPSPK